MADHQRGAYSRVGSGDERDNNTHAQGKGANIYKLRVHVQYSVTCSTSNLIRNRVLP